MNLFSRLFGSQVVQIDPGQVELRLREKPAPFLLDVRQPEEYRDEHIAGAKLIPLGELGRRMQELPRDRPIVCVCRSGNRSGVAAQQLNGAGYQTSNLRGGMIAWRQAGLPVRRGQA